MQRWSQFEQAAPGIAGAGRALLYHPERGEVAILATVDAAGQPWVAPICPIFAGDGIYVLAGAATPKAAHLSANGRYALHAMVGADDTEFQIRGAARQVQDEEERRRIIDAITFDSFDSGDPIYEFLIDRALAVTWPEPGVAKKRVWKSA